MKNLIYVDNDQSDSITIAHGLETVLEKGTIGDKLFHKHFSANIDNICIATRFIALFLGG